ncbi:hypothetical protein BC830DRAFT_1092175 [Chytriomyces sp. MP71]|nr:hypothetical protein BC830DRAFT_1092175 [Chytriomyces sp. MP71]
MCICVFCYVVESWEACWVMVLWTLLWSLPAVRYGSSFCLVKADLTCVDVGQVSNAYFKECPYPSSCVITSNH